MMISISEAHQRDMRSRGSGRRTGRTGGREDEEKINKNSRGRSRVGKRNAWKDKSGEL